MYIECSPLYFNSKKEAMKLVPDVIDKLLQLSFIGSEVVIKSINYLEHSYCIPNNKVSEKIRKYLGEFGIYSIGRYRSWHCQANMKICNKL
jgi:hypothetical protein